MFNWLIYLRELLLLKRFFQESWRAVLARKGSTGNSCPDRASRSEAALCGLPHRSCWAASEPWDSRVWKTEQLHSYVLPASHSDQYKSYFSLGLPLHREFVFIEVCETAVGQTVPLMFPVLLWCSLCSCGDSSLCFFAPSRQRSSLVRRAPPHTPGWTQGHMPSAPSLPARWRTVMGLPPELHPPAAGNPSHPLRIPTDIPST